MKIINKLKTNKLGFSFEFFPPKNSDQEQDFFNTIDILKQFDPLFMSVTYGALGTTQEKSLSIIKQIKQKHDIALMAHYTCIGAKKQDIDMFLDKLKEYEIDNILALRGDIPADVNKDDVLHEFNYASDLVSYIKKKTDYFSIGVAGYPEGHIEAESKELDIDFLKKKIDAGAEFIITQLFFDNNYFYDFCGRLQKAGINVPVLPGIMPVTNYKMIERITKMCNVNVPKEIKDFFSKDNLSLEDKKKFAFDWIYNQTQGLISNNFNKIHFYTLNKSSIVFDLCKKSV